ncbi:MAG: hypothetical protein Q4D06_07555 [Coriobacteriia bacterium]|nr:hypothetical protein [Coriobacteriia bacterium]
MTDMAEQDVCAVPQEQLSDDFDALLAGWQTQKHWIHFFIRPCCPAPQNDVAQGMVDKLKGDIAASAFSDEQKAQLAAIADERMEWYRTLSVRKGK